MAALVCLPLPLRPNLWMLMWWLVLSALWSGAKLFGLKPNSFPPSFWSNALVTILILLGPAIEDNAIGKDVYGASTTRVGLFVGVALYAWTTVWALERWRASRSRALFLKRT